MRPDRHAHALSIRPATRRDIRRVFDWRNDPFIVSRGSSHREVGWDEHSRWFLETLDGNSRRMFLIFLGNRAIGQARLDRLDRPPCLISIYLLERFTGRGLGVAALRLVCAEAFSSLGVREIRAHIRNDNPGSASAFLKAGFTLMRRARSTPRAHRSFRLASPPQVRHNRLTHGDVELGAITSVVRSGQWACGPKVLELEEALARAAHVRHAVCVASGFSALRLALKGLQTSPGDEVILPAYSCVALPNAVLALSAKPIPCDVSSEDWNINPRPTRAPAARPPRPLMIAVSTFGVPAQAKALRAKARLIEDCAHAFGIASGGEPLGSRAEASILSFYATKLIGAGSGGAVLTDSPSIAECVRAMRDYQDQPPSAFRHNDRITDITAALALAQLERLPAMLSSRRALAERYLAELSRHPAYGTLFRLPAPTAHRAWYRFCIELTRTTAADAIPRLQRHGVQTAEPVYDWHGERSPSYPIANRAFRRLLSLPLYPTLSYAEQTQAIHSLNRYFDEALHA